MYQLAIMFSNWIVSFLSIALIEDFCKSSKNSCKMCMEKVSAGKIIRVPDNRSGKNDM